MTKEDKIRIPIYIILKYKLHKMIAFTLQKNICENNNAIKNTNSDAYIAKYNTTVWYNMNFTGHISYNYKDVDLSSVFFGMILRKILYVYYICTIYLEF